MSNKLEEYHDKQIRLKDSIISTLQDELIEANKNSYNTFELVCACISSGVIGYLVCYALN